MNILFCHDGPVNCDSEGRYYSIGFNDKLLDRYAEIFEHVGIVTRVDRTTSASAYNEADKLTIEKYRVVEHPNYLTLRGIFANKKNSTQQLEKEITQCDALIIRLPSFLGSKCVRIAQKYQKPFLIELVGCPWDSLRNHGLSGKVLAPYMYLVTKRQVKDASDVLYVTNKFLQKRYPTKGRQIGCSDVALQQANQNTAAIQPKIKPIGKKMVVGSLGKIDLKYKGYATVLQAMQIMAAQGYDVTYQIVGPGDKRYLQSVAQKYGVSSKVEFVGSMGHDRVFSWMDTLDIYIQPSLTEGMPRALLEAMSRGCPCVASDAGGMPELLESNYIFKKGNAKQLAHILMQGTQNGLLDQGLRNAELTIHFMPEVLHQKRTDFYTQFKSSVVGR